MNMIEIIVSALVIDILNRIFKFFSKKKDNTVKVDVWLPYTKEELLCDVAFALMALPAWGFTLWVFSKAGFRWEQLLMCLLITIGGLACLLLHRVDHGIKVPKGKEHLAESVKQVVVKSNRLMSLFAFPLMVAYIISKNPSLFSISWDFEWVCIAILIVAFTVDIGIQFYYSRLFHIDITESDLNQ